MKGNLLVVTVLGLAGVFGAAAPALASSGPSATVSVQNNVVNPDPTPSSTTPSPTPDSITVQQQAVKLKGSPGQTESVNINWQATISDVKGASIMASAATFSGPSGSFPASALTFTTNGQTGTTVYTSSGPQASVSGTVTLMLTEPNVPGGTYTAPVVLTLVPNTS